MLDTSCFSLPIQVNSPFSNRYNFTLAKKFMYRCKLYSETLVILNIGLVGQIFRYFVLKNLSKQHGK